MGVTARLRSHGSTLLTLGGGSRVTSGSGIGKGCSQRSPDGLGETRRIFIMGMKCALEHLTVPLQYLRSILGWCLVKCGFGISNALNLLLTAQRQYCASDKRYDVKVDEIVRRQATTRFDTHLFCSSSAERDYGSS